MSLTVKEVLKFVIVFLLLLLYKLKKIPKILNHNDKSRNFCLISANLNGPKGSSLEVTCCKICSARTKTWIHKNAIHMYNFCIWRISGWYRQWKILFYTVLTFIIFAQWKVIFRKMYSIIMIKVHLRWSSYVSDFASSLKI